MNYIGNGIYTYKEASLLTNISVNTLRRWVEGYKRPQSAITIAPIIHSDYSKIESSQVLSFLDLVEVLFIKAFQSYGISLQTIRTAVNRASKLLNSEHPFAMKKFYTDGKTILAKIAHDGNSVDLIDLLKKQYQIVDVVLPHLYECIDFNQFDFAERWWPNGKLAGIVVDPNRSFGQPIIHDLNIKTHLIQELYNSGHSIEDIIDWYDIDKKYVKMALDFETRKTA